MQSDIASFISTIYRIVDKDGVESVYIPTGDSVLPWDEETRKRLPRLFNENTRFLVKDERRCRKYQGSRDWWLTMTAEQFIESCIMGWDIGT